MVWVSTVVSAWCGTVITPWVVWNSSICMVWIVVCFNFYLGHTSNPLVMTCPCDFYRTLISLGGPCSPEFDFFLIFLGISVFCVCCFHFVCLSYLASAAWTCLVVGAVSVHGDLLLLPCCGLYGDGCYVWVAAGLWWGIWTIGLSAITTVCGAWDEDDLRFYFVLLSWFLQVGQERLSWNLKLLALNLALHLLTSCQGWTMLFGYKSAFVVWYLCCIPWGPLLLYIIDWANYDARDCT